MSFVPAASPPDSTATCHSLREIALRLEYSVEAGVAPAFAWQYRTDVSTWNDPPLGRECRAGGSRIRPDLHVGMRRLAAEMVAARKSNTNL